MNISTIHCGTLKFPELPANYSPTDTFVYKTWKGFPRTVRDFYANRIWTDGTNIYYSYETDQYVLNGDTWEVKTWNGLTSFMGSRVWTDGTNIYHSLDNNHHILNGDTWEEKTWNGLTSFSGTNVWTDGTNIYFSTSDRKNPMDGVLFPSTAALYQCINGEWKKIGNLV